MRIRKRFHNPLPAPDLSCPPPPSTAAAAAAAAVAVAPSVAVPAGSKGGEATAGAAAAGLADGSLSGSGGCGGTGKGESGLHPNGDLAAFHGCTGVMATSRLPFHLPPSEAATGEGEERRDPSPAGTRLTTGHVPLGRSWEVLKREKDDGEDGRDGVAYRRWNAGAYSGAAMAPKRSGAEVSKLSLAHDAGYKTLPDGTTAAEVLARWGDEEKGFPLKKRRGCYRARPGTRLEGEDDNENAAAEREVVKPRRIKIRGRATTPSVAAAGTAVITAVTDINGGAPAATVAGVPRKCEDMAVKEEGGDVPSASGAPTVDGNRGGGNGKRRRSPAVLMEGSRCSRVNGRGWRCCQQTLVGYSLCEHHLGKGRLRSVSSVRCNSRAKKKEESDGAALSLLPSPLQQPDEEEIKPRRRRNKIGMVKARSISSLLNQAYYSTPETATAPAAPAPSLPPFPAPPTGDAAATTAPTDHVKDAAGIVLA